MDANDAPEPQEAEVRRNAPRPRISDSVRDRAAGAITDRRVRIVRDPCHLGSDEPAFDDALGISKAHRTRTPASRPACTVKVFPGDNLMVHKSLDLARPGDVVVVDAAAATTHAVLGDLVATKARHRGIAGFVVDGLCATSRASSLLVICRSSPAASARSVPCIAAQGKSTFPSPWAASSCIRVTSSSGTTTAWSWSPGRRVVRSSSDSGLRPAQKRPTSTPSKLDASRTTGSTTFSHRAASRRTTTPKRGEPPVGPDAGGPARRNRHRPRRHPRWVWLEYP